MTTATKAGGAVLKPCPFCGVVPVIERCADTHDYVYGPRKWWGVHCRSTLNRGGTCAVEIRPQASVEAAVARWNTRAPAQATIDELRAEVERLTRERDEWRGRVTEAHREREAAVSAHEAAQRAGFSFRDEVVELRRQRAALRAALHEVCAVLQTDTTAIIDTVWVSTGQPETLLDHCREALRAALLGDGGTL